MTKKSKPSATSAAAALKSFRKLFGPPIVMGGEPAQTYDAKVLAFLKSAGRTDVAAIIWADDAVFEDQVFNMSKRAWAGKIERTAASRRKVIEDEAKELAARNPSDKDTEETADIDDALRADCLAVVIEEAPINGLDALTKHFQDAQAFAFEAQLRSAEPFERFAETHRRNRNEAIQELRDNRWANTASPLIIDAQYEVTDDTPLTGALSGPAEECQPGSADEAPSIAADSSRAITELPIDADLADTPSQTSGEQQ